MVHIIVKPTRGERDAAMAESASRSTIPGVRGVVRRTEEAVEVSRQIERESGHEPTIAVSGDAPESKQARMELAIRMGSRDPERDQAYV